MTKLMVAFRNFAKAPKIMLVYLVLVHILFRHSLTNVNSFIGDSEKGRMLYNISFLTKLSAFLMYVNNRRTAELCSYFFLSGD